MKVELINYTVNPVNAMADAAAVCYDSIPNKYVVKHCLESGHLSIAEFADFHFEISEVSRALSHQLVRHRMASYAQRSQRYVEEDNFNYVIPNSVIRKGLPELLDYNDLMDKIQEMYYKLVEIGIPKEDARYILPNAAYTVIHVKMNFRELMHFCNVRMCSKAQWEIRKLAEMMAKEVKEVSPFLAEYLVPKGKAQGFCNEKDSCRKCFRKEE
jgi:thymidylate synthase (FAD)